MPVSKAQIRAVEKYREKNQDRITLVGGKADMALIRAAAAAAGQSLNRYILDAVRARMATEHLPDAPAAPDYQSTD